MLGVARHTLATEPIAVSQRVVLDRTLKNKTFGMLLRRIFLRNRKQIVCYSGFTKQWHDGANQHGRNLKVAKLVEQSMKKKKLLI